MLNVERRMKGLIRELIKERETEREREGEKEGRIQVLFDHSYTHTPQCIQSLAEFFLVLLFFSRLSNGHVIVKGKDIFLELFIRRFKIIFLQLKKQRPVRLIAQRVLTKRSFFTCIKINIG